MLEGVRSGCETDVFTSPSMFQANLVSTALGPDQMAPSRIGLIVGSAHRATLALVTFATLCRTFRDRRFRFGWNRQGTPYRQRYQTGHG